MRSFFSEHINFIAILVISALWLVFFPIWSDWVTANPLDEEIALNPRGTISKVVRVVIPEYYELNFVFEYPSDQQYVHDQLKELVGDWTYRDGKPVPSGVRVPIRWALKDVTNGSVVSSGEVESFGSISYSATEVDRQIGHIHVAPGRYLFTAEILRDVPEFSLIKTRISMELHSKASSTWQISLVWWGTIASVFIIWPAAGMVALVLTWEGFSSFRARKRAMARVFQNQ